MKVTQEKLPASQLGLEIEISPEMSKNAYEQVIQEFSRSANIPGFRKGKVPRQILIQRMGSTRLKAAAVEDLVQNSIKKAIEQEKINALGNFQLRSSFEELVNAFQPGQSFTFLAAVDVSPEVELNQYTGFTVQVEEIKPKFEEIDELLDRRRSELATLIPVERPAQMGDVAIVDFKGRFFPSEDTEAEDKEAEDKEAKGTEAKDAEAEDAETEGTKAEGQEIPGGQAEDFQLEIKEGKFIPGFTEGIVGMSPGETRDISVQFPPDYPDPDLAGHPAVFSITLKELKEKDLPPLDDEFAQEISEYQTLAELRSTLEKRYQHEADRKTASNKEQALLAELLKNLEVEIPETLIDQEVSYILTQMAMQLQEQGFDYKQLFTQEALPDLRQRSRPEAINRIKRTLALSEVAKRESIQVEPEAVTTKVADVMRDVKDKQSIDQDRLRTVVEEDLLKEKIIKWLEENSTIELVSEGTLTSESELAAQQLLEGSQDEAKEVLMEEDKEAEKEGNPEAIAPAATETEFSIESESSDEETRETQEVSTEEMQEVVKTPETESE